jgi:eukaryotic-like serine/threonine-protein kinase
MSPEQCEGKPNVDHRTDVYALGICLYEMLVGRVPFIGEGYGEILVQHLAQAPVPPSRYRMMSPHVEAVVMKALEKRPEMRYPTMDEMIRALSDPVGFVEAHGGVGGFAHAQLMPSTAPLPDIRMTPAPMTPMPGLMSPVPGTLKSPVPTTLSQAAGQAGPAGARNRTGFIVGGVVVVAAVAIAIVVVVSNKKSDAGATADPIGSAGSGSTIAVTPVPTPTPTPTPNGSGSAASKTPDLGVGSGSGKIEPKDRYMSVTVTSTPPGAEIFIDGVDLQKVTDATLSLPVNHTKAEILLRMKGFEDFVFSDVALDGKDLKEAAALVPKKVVQVPTGKGSASVGKGSASAGKGSASAGKGSAAGKGSGKGSGHKDNDTGLMRPEDL